MKTSFQIALPLLVILFGASAAHAQLNVSGSADCPLEAFDLVGVFDSAPMPAVTVKIVNGATPQTGVEVDFTIPADTYFAGFLAPVPANVLYFDGSTWSATLPTVEPVAVRVVLGNLAGGANETFGVMLREFPTPGPQASYMVAARSNEDATGVTASRTLRLGACPALVYALNCLSDGVNLYCASPYSAIEGRPFTFAGVGGAPTSALTQATDVDGFAPMPRLVDLTFLNDEGGDVSNDGYPLPGLTYTISHTLPNDPAPPSNGPFWTNATAGTQTWTVLPTRDGQQIHFVDNVSCVEVACQTATFRLTTDGAGVCEYEPTVVNGECTVDDLCLTNVRCEAGACIGDPILCEDPGTCQSDSGSCNPSTGLCVYGPVDCATETFTFFGVIDNGDGTLASFECQINDGVGEVLCRVAGGGFAATGELLLGGPECVSAVVNDPPSLPPTRFELEEGIGGSFQLAGVDPENDVIAYAADTSLPGNWTLNPSGVLTVAASAAPGEYQINVTLADGTNPPVPAVITVQVFAVRFVFATDVYPNPDWANPGGFIQPNFPGSNGALLNADAICQAAASTGIAAVRSGNYVAWLSTSSPLVHAKNRIIDAIYRLPDGTDVARGKADLLDSWLPYRIAVMADGSPVGTTVAVWTGTNAAGESTGSNCNNWTDNTSAYTATIGGTGNNNGVPNASIHEIWTERTVLWRCDYPAILYCFEQ